MKRLKKIVAMILCVLMLAQSMAAGSSVFAASEEETSVTPQAETRIVSFDLQDGSPVQSFELFSWDNIGFLADLHFSSKKHNWGKCFMGWSCTPNSTTVDYNLFPDNLPDDVTTLYGVWSAAKEVALSEKITTENNRMTLRFTPPEDNLYSVLIATGKNNIGYAYCFNTDGEVKCSFEQGSNYREMVFGLKGNVTYELDLIFSDLIFSDHNKVDVSIEVTAGVNTLTLIGNVKGQTYKAHINGVHCWDYIKAYTFSSLNKALMENKYNLMGWSYSPDAKKVDIKPYGSIQLTEDVTLYAVVEPWKALEDNRLTLRNTYKDTSYYFEFTPEKSGRYSMGISELTEDNYSISCEQVNSGADGLYALLAGETYTFSVRYYADLSGTITIAAERETYYAYNLNFCFDYVGYDRAFSFDIDCTDSIRLPLIAPPSFFNKGFLGWQDTSRDDGRIYKPGEKIYLDKDTTLVSVWKTVCPEPEGNPPLTYSQAIRNMFMVPRMFLFLFTLGGSAIRQLFKIVKWAK